MIDDELKKLAPDETWPMICGESFYLNEKWVQPFEAKWSTDAECIAEMKAAIRALKKKEKGSLR